MGRGSFAVQFQSIAVCKQQVDRSSQTLGQQVSVSMCNRESPRWLVGTERTLVLMPMIYRGNGYNNSVRRVLIIVVDQVVVDNLLHSWVAEAAELGPAAEH